MNINRMRKHMVFSICYGGTLKGFLKTMRSYKSGINHIPARKVKREWSKLYDTLWVDSSCAGLEVYAKLLGLDLNARDDKDAAKVLTFGLRYGYTAPARSQVATSTFRYMYSGKRRG